MSEPVIKITGAWYRKMKLAGKHKPKEKPDFVKKILAKQKLKAKLQKKITCGFDKNGIFHGSSLS